jgi:hypothetical protein
VSNKNVLLINPSLKFMLSDVGSKFMLSDVYSIHFLISVQYYHLLCIQFEFVSKFANHPLKASHCLHVLLQEMMIV